MKEELLEPVLRFFRIRTISPYIPENAILCDIGCGFDATFLREISDKISKGYGFDRKVASFTEKNIIVENLDIESTLPLSEGSADCVTILAVLEHLNDPQKVLDESYRIINSTGVIIITTPAPRSKPILELLSLKLHIVSPSEILDHKHYYSKDEIRLLLKNAGFSQIIVKSFEWGLNYLAVGYKGRL